MNLSLFIEEADRRFVSNFEQPPVVPSIREALGFDNNTIIGTYDHLRTPFSNRILSADERFSKLCTSIEASGVLFILDCTMPPAWRYRGTHIGYTMGLSDLLGPRPTGDEITVDPKSFFSFQPILKLPVLSTKWWNRFYTAIVNLLRCNITLPRRKALNIASAICARGHILESIYYKAFSKACVNDESIASALMNVRAKLRNYCGLKEKADGIQVVLYSDIRNKLAMALEHFLRKMSISHDFWSRCTQFFSVDSLGHYQGVYKYNSISGKFLHTVNSNIYSEIKYTDMPTKVATGCVVMTTQMLYVLLHLAGGIPHYGNSYDMYKNLSKLVKISRPYVDITRDGTNSVTIGSICADLPKRRIILRNTTADILWYKPDNYIRLINSTVLNGQTSFNVNFNTDIPDE